jgi:hypothetical protein
MKSAFCFLVLVTLVLSTCFETDAIRQKRQVVIKQRLPISDRSVYARRNFAQPEVVSDVYEVYVGPSQFVSEVLPYGVVSYFENHAFS